MELTFVEPRQRNAAVVTQWAPCDRAVMSDKELQYSLILQLSLDLDGISSSSSTLSLRMYSSSQVLGPFRFCFMIGLFYSKRTRCP